MAIIISKAGSRSAAVVNASDFAHERNLQEYIYDHPETIPVYELREDKRLLVAARELQTESGAIDAFAVDQDGDIYIVETKLYRNPDKRTVVAQALDYGASLWRHGEFDRVLSALDQAASKQWKMTFRDMAADFFSLDDQGIEDLIASMRTNLSDGKLKFVILMDRLDDQLKDLITYINQNSQFDIYAIELEYYKHEAYEIVIPKLYGAEVKKDVAVSGAAGARRKWTESETLESAKQELAPEVYEGFEKLFAFSKERADSINLGTGISRGSFGPVFEKMCPRTIFTLRTNGMLSFNFQWIDGTEAALRFRNAYLAKMKEVGFDVVESDLNKFPGFEPGDWLPKVDKMVAALKELVMQG